MPHAPLLLSHSVTASYTCPDFCSNVLDRWGIGSKMFKLSWESPENVGVLVGQCHRNLMRTFGIVVELV